MRVFENVSVMIIFRSPRGPKKSQNLLRKRVQKITRPAFSQSYSSKKKPLTGNILQTVNDHVNVISSGSKGTNKNENSCIFLYEGLKILKNRFPISVQCSGR